MDGADALGPVRDRRDAGRVYYVRRLFDDRVGFLTALILGTTVQYLQAGSGARVDMTLTFFLEIAFFEFILIAEGLTGGG